MRWTLVVSFSIACASCGPERGASLTLSEGSGPSPTPQTTAEPAPTSTASSAPTPPEAPPAPPPLEAIEPGPILTENDPAVPLAREVPLPGPRTVIVPESLTRDGRPGLHELYALTEERFVYLDAHRLAVIDAEAGRVVGTRVLDETVERVSWTFSADRGGRFVGFARSDQQVCVWDLDLDRVDCTPGVEGLVSPGGRSVFVSDDDGGFVRLDLSNARRHELGEAPTGQGLTLAAISPSERRIVATHGSPSWPHGGPRGRVWLLDAATGAPVRTLENTVLPRNPFRPQGGTWVTWKDGSLELRDTLTGALRRREPLPEEPHRMYWSADGQSVIAYHYVSGRARATRLDATTGETRGEVPLSPIRGGFYTPGFRANGSFDFGEEFEVPSATGRTAVRVDDGGLTLRQLAGGEPRVFEDDHGEGVVLDVVALSDGLVLVTPYGHATLSPTGLTWSSNGLLHLVELSEDDPPDSDGEDWTNYAFDEAGLLSLGAGLFVDRFGGTPHGPRGRDIGLLPSAPIPCEHTGLELCCLATGSHDERSGRRVLRRLDRLEIAPPEGTGVPRTVWLSSCDEECGQGEQCDGEECTRDTTDPLSGSCMLRPSEEPRFDAAGRVVVTTGHAGVVETFDVATSRRLGRIARARGEELPTQAFDIAPDASVVAFARGRNLHLHEVSGERRGTAEARFARPVRFVRYLASGAILAGLVDDSLHFVDATTLAESGTIARPGFRADAPSRLASVLCREGSLRWLEHRPGATAETAREIGHCDRDARMIVTNDLAFVLEVQGGRVVLHRVDDGRALTLSLGQRTRPAEDVDDEEYASELRARTVPWVIAMNDAGAIEHTPTTRPGAYARRTGGVRRGTFSPAFGPADVSPVVAAFLTPSPSPSEAGSSGTSTAATTPTTAPGTPIAPVAPIAPGR